MTESVGQRQKISVTPVFVHVVIHLCFPGTQGKYQSLSINMIISPHFFISAFLHFLLSTNSCQKQSKSSVWFSMWPLIIKTDAVGWASHEQTGSPTSEIIRCSRSEKKQYCFLQNFTFVLVIACLFWLLASYLQQLIRDWNYSLFSFKVCFWTLST